MSTSSLSHHKHLGRLNRIIGQVEGVKRMIEEQRYCVDILTQLSAVREAVKSVERTMLEGHLHHCVRNVLENPADQKAIEEKITEIQKILKNL